MHPERTRVIVNTHEQMTGQFAPQCRPGVSEPTPIVGRIRAAAGAGNVQVLDATRISTRLLGDAIASNLFLLGYAYQQGLVPVSGAAVERAIELNAIAVEMNRGSVPLGTAGGARPEGGGEPGRSWLTKGWSPPHRSHSTNSSSGRASDLAQWQNEAWATRYRGLVARVRDAERELGAAEALSGAVARNALQADGVQGRVRGGPPLHRRRLPRAAGGGLRR